MNEYELKIYNEIILWKRKLLKKSPFLQRVSKKAQGKINELIPAKAHQMITDSIKQMVKALLVGSYVTTKKENRAGSSLMEKDKMAAEKLSFYRKTATLEGAGTGAGGIFLGLADFPLLLSIKMKYLSETATIYGFNPEKLEERIFILHVFSLAFSSDEKRLETFDVIENWEERKQNYEDMDWQSFQQEYRDHIDFIKMLQLVPGIGAVVGAYANYNLLDSLGEVAMNCYRLRLLKTAPTA
ncbi:EcsC family protein [Robertmurraya korlensis]|uniref:EcsC family protein n=1 Tax=Robertmurraya korlensis TaxID=519977 RepID=UPI00203A7C8E|nr:EcsC family protein [Robertmurraya korlensis]MCM3602286.1 EcsC family protein [Robertmurraya korlensis]